MTNFTDLLLADRGQPAKNLHIVDRKGFDDWLAARPVRVRTMLAAAGFKAKADEVALVPGDGPGEFSAVIGVSDCARLRSWCLARAAEMLPEGQYRADGPLGDAALGWLLSQHSFTRYRKPKDAKGPRVLLTDAPAQIEETIRIAEATALTRELINTGAADLGPAEIEAETRRLAGDCGAVVKVTCGERLAADFPMIHAVGAAAAAGREPRLVELEWGNPAHPRIAIVGKGITFDTGGLDIKPSSGMRLMKKDMGGAAHALALAALVMKGRLPVRLHLLLPLAENGIGPTAMRPGDVLRSRKGLSVEVHNTDAEGRLVLADALTRAVEAEPELIIDFATLTGAARVALGPDLPALFSNDDSLAHALSAAGQAVDDPVWRLPLWTNYDELYRSDVADMSNASESPFAGAITAALFLKRFVPAELPWAHFDTFAWRPSSKPGRPKGGDALSLRAGWQMLRSRYPASGH